MNSLVGIGVYSVPEAAALTGIPSREIRRWLFGYNAKNRAGETVHHNGLWIPLPSQQGLDETISFQDLIEIRFVYEFRKHGVHLHTIRAAANRAKSLFDAEYPFTCKRFQTDGRDIFATIFEETEDETLIDLVKQQYVFKSVITPSLYAGIEYSESNTALRWYPIKKSKKVVLDPAIAFGKPIVTDYGVPTEALYQCWKAENENVSLVALQYEVPKSAVEAAIQFEQRMAAGALFH